MGPIGFPETSVTTNQYCVTSQKSEDLKIELNVLKQMKVNVDNKKAINTFENELLHCSSLFHSCTPVNQTIYCSYYLHLALHLYPSGPYWMLFLAC